MRTIKTLGIVFLMILSSCLGAILSKYFSPTTAEAQIDMDILKAKSFLLADESGKTRAFFSLREGNPVLGFLDAYGNKNLAIGSVDGKPFVRLYEDNKLAVAIGKSEEEMGLYLYNKYEVPLALVGITADGVPTLGIYSKDQKRGSGLTLLEGEPVFFANDKKGNTIGIGAVQGEFGIVIKDKDKKPKAGVVLTEEGDPVLAAYGVDAKAITAMMVLNDAPLLYARDNNEKILWNQPKYE